MSSSPEPGTDSVILLQGRSVPTREEYLARVATDTEAIGKLYDEVVALREILKNFARGDFSARITQRGAIWGHLKSLQANLQHLT